MNDDSYPFTEFSSIEELCSLISKETKGWDTKWYRGLKSPHYTLLPKLFRDSSLSKREGYIAVEFRRRARSHLNGICTTFEWLCAMQHFGLPTRLLDWTESLPVALYFTVRPWGFDLIAPTIWVLNPFELYTLSDSKGDPVIPIAADERVLANADISFGDEINRTAKHVTARPLPVVPDFLFNRLATQNGTFTIHGKDTRPLEQIVPKTRRNSLLKFVAKQSRINDVCDCLDLIIPSSDSIFPDIEGVKDYII